MAELIEAPQKGVALPHPVLVLGLLFVSVAPRSHYGGGKLTNFCSLATVLGILSVGFVLCKVSAALGRFAETAGFLDMFEDGSGAENI